MLAPPPDTAAMSAPQTLLDDAQIERLSELLDQRAVPFKGFNLEALDGFLSALVLSPSPVPPEEWQPLVWGGKPPRWDSDAEAAEVQRLLEGHWNMCAARVRHDEDSLPDHLAPLMWLPEDPELTGEDALHEDELDVGRDWALGFFEAWPCARPSGTAGWTRTSGWRRSSISSTASPAASRSTPTIRPRRRCRWTTASACRS